MAQLLRSAIHMDSISAKEAGERLEELLRQVTASHRPIQIMGEADRAVLLSEQDWRDMEETLYLGSIPGMKESIKEGMKTPIVKCFEDRAW
jgi:PHD/YefM family antitoxin component YafN of YafNO toxin-antitoxin module